MRSQRRYRKKKANPPLAPPFRGRYPVSFLVVIVITIIFILWGLLGGQDILILSFYTLIIFGILYLPFSRHASRFRIENGSLKIHYFFSSSVEVDLLSHDLIYIELGSSHQDYGRYRLIGTHDILQFEHRETRDPVIIHMNSLYMDMHRLLAIIPYKREPLRKQRKGLLLHTLFSEGFDV